MATARMNSRLDRSRVGKNRSQHAAPGVVLNYSSNSSLSDDIDKKDASKAFAPIVADPHTEDGNKNRGVKVSICEPRPLDICCGRGKGSVCHPGNLIFQEVIRKNVDRYDQADSKSLRSDIVSEILYSLHLEHNLRFIKKDPVVGLWFVLSVGEAHEKTGHAIRDQLALMRRKKLPHQEKISLDTQIPVSCSCSVSSRKSNRNTTKGVKSRQIPCKAKHQVQTKKIKKTTPSTPQRDLLLGEPGLHFHEVSLEEAAHQELWSEHFLGNDSVVPLSLAVNDASFHHEYDQRDDLSKHVLGLHVQWLPQSSHALSLENMSPLSALPNDSLENSTLPPHRVSPENNRYMYVLPSTLQTTREDDISEDDLEPIPLLPNIPFPVEDLHTPCHHGAETGTNSIFDSPKHEMNYSCTC